MELTFHILFFKKVKVDQFNSETAHKPNDLMFGLNVSCFSLLCGCFKLNLDDYAGSLRSQTNIDKINE